MVWIYPNCSVTKEKNPDGEMSGCIVNVNTAHASHLKAFLETRTKSWPGRTHLVTQGMVDGVQLCTVGRKHFKKKTMCFLFAKGSSSAEEGEPCGTRQTDENGSSMHREVKRPECYSKHVSVSSAIDILNQRQQKKLRLENFWVAENGFLMIICTKFGTCVVDCWTSCCYHLPYNHRHEKCELMTVANMLAMDLLEILEDDTVDMDEQSLSIGVGRESREVQPHWI